MKLYHAVGEVDGMMVYCAHGMYEHVFILFIHGLHRPLELFVQ